MSSKVQDVAGVWDLKIPLLQHLSLKFYMKWLALIKPDKAQEIAYTHFTRPFRRIAGEKDIPLLNAADRSQVQLNGTAISVKSWGNSSNSTVVLVHGWGSHAMRFRDIIQMLLDKGFHVVAFDGPAHGESEGERASGFHIAWTLKLVTGKIGKIHGVIGHSIGGFSVVYALTRLGLLPNRAVVISSPASIEAITVPFVRFLGIPLKTMEQVISKFEKWVEQPLSTLDLPDMIASIKVPGLIIQDEDDPMILPPNGEIYHLNWEKSQLVKTKGLGHHKVLNDPAVVEKITAFLKE